MSLGLATRGMFGSGGSGNSDVTSPTITIVSPIPGTVIGPSTPLVFRYEDETGLQRPMPCIKFRQPGDPPSYKYELIHDGVDFTPDYTGTKEIIQADPPIWQFTVRRKGGWTGTLQYHGVQPGDGFELVPFGTDTGGNEPT
jgi:hypothetical protein